jgi:hypothetical protein
MLIYYHIKMENTMSEQQQSDAGYHSGFQVTIRIILFLGGLTGVLLLLKKLLGL